MRLDDIPDDRHECPECGAGFKRRSKRHDHRLDEHPEALPEGAAGCADCEGDADPNVNAIRDPTTGRDRRNGVCPRCGESVPVDGRFV